MREELIGYLFGALDHDTHTLVEQYLQTNPNTHFDLHRIRRATIELLSYDGGHLPAPDGLAFRTVERCLNDSMRGEESGELSS